MKQQHAKNPGEVIREFLIERGWTQTDLARILGRAVSSVNEIIQGKQSITPEIAMALGAAFGKEPQFWMTLEANRQLAAAEGQSDDVRKRAALFEIAPIKDMERRGWIRRTSTADELEQELLQFYKISCLADEPAIHGAMRKTAPAIAASPAQKAWAFRVRQLAAAIPSASVAQFNESKLDACKRDLRKLASYSAGVQKVPALLLSYGIRFVVVEGLSGAKMDGFATWLDSNSPVIGMSLRFDRLDSFWFTLGHEVIHIKYKDIAPIDGDVGSVDDLPLEVKSPVEQRADKESAELFIPPDELKSFILRVGPLYSTEKINQFANRIKMHPNVIIGQLKHRGEIKRSAHNKTSVPIRDIVVKAAVTDGWGKSIDTGAIS